VKAVLGRRREARSARRVGAAAWAKGKRGMKAALPWMRRARKPGGGRLGEEWPQPSTGKMPRLRAGYEAEGRAKMKMKVWREAVSDERAAALLAQSAPVFEAVLRAAGVVRAGEGGSFARPSGLLA